MNCSTAIRAVVLSAALGCFAPVSAQVQGSADEHAPVQVSGASPIQIHQEPVGPEPAPKLAPSIEHVDISVENKPLSVRLQRTDADGVLIEASPIFAHLKGEASIEDTVLSYRRFQDGALITLDFSDGKVRANGLVLGALPNFEAQEEATTWLSINAISVLTGTIVSENENSGWTFTLDERLRPKFDLNLFVNGAQVDVSLVEPRSIGPVLLIPLEPVAQELGHVVERLEGNVISITRIQDGAIFTLDLSTGLISVRGVPRGVTPNISYADPETLLLPFTAVETLTGTHITLVPGSNRIDVELDDRLAGSALPGERVVDEVAATGFTPESLEFQLSDRGPAFAQLNSRFRGLSSQLQYESAGGITSPEELVPSRVTLDVESIDGWVGSLGDANARFRELGGVDQSRIRGATFRRRNQENGRLLAIAGGTVANGAEQISPTASRPTFGGFAGGARLISADRSTELGLSASVGDTGRTDRVVVSGQLQRNWAQKERGLTGIFLSSDVGVFDGANGVEFDGRVRASGRYDLTKQFGAQVNLSYDGAAFGGTTQLQTDETDVPDFEGVLSDASASRFVGSLSTDWRSVRNWGPLARVGVGAQANYSRTGGTNGNETVSVSGAVNTHVSKVGVDLSADVSYSSSKSGAESFSGTTTSVRAFKSFDWGAARLNYTNSIQDGESQQRLIGTLQVNPVRKRFAKGAVVALGPTLSGVWSPEEASARLGATASANSGQLFGPKLNVQGQISALQSVDPNNSQTGFLANLAADYQITRNIGITASYFDNLAGQRDFAIGLRGRVQFNAQRKHNRPVEGRGVLRGKVFFDRNRDGVRQEDEPGVPGVRVNVTATRLALNVDREGNFTIQNMRPGLYGLAIDRRTLPLGLLVAEDSAARATIGEDRITDIEIPIIASGQIRGTVFVDNDASGDVDAGEPRIEGHFIKLRRTDDNASEDDEYQTLSASFGQYSFENLSPGDYELSINHGGIVYSQSLELTEDELFMVQPFALPGADNAGEGGGRTIIDYDSEVIGEA